MEWTFVIRLLLAGMLGAVIGFAIRRFCDLTKVQIKEDKCIEIIKNEGGGNGASIVPIAFPLIAGPGALTALLSLRADHAVINILIALLLNVLFAFIVLASIDKIEKVLGKATIFILRKFFGVILLALAVNMFVDNLATVIASLN